MEDTPRGDMALLDAWRVGDRAAAEALFDRYYPMLARYFRNKVSTGAEDLIQQTFMTCVEGRDRIQADSDKGLRGYLFGVAHNVLRAHYRRKRRDLPTDFNELSIRDMDAGPSSLYTRRQEQRLLLEALRAIPLELQFILELSYWEQMSSAEIADIVQVPRPTVRSRLRRARELLECALTELAESPQQLESTLSDLSTWVAELRAQLAA